MPCTILTIKNWRNKKYILIKIEEKNFTGSEKSFLQDSYVRAMSAEGPPRSMPRRPSSKEEMDLLQRSKKKVRTDDDGESFSGTSSRIPRDEDWMHDAAKSDEIKEKKKFYLVSWMGEEIVISSNTEVSDESDEEVGSGDKAEMDDGSRYVVEDDDPIKGPNIIPSRQEEKCLRKPLRRTLIIKLLGKKIGFGFLKKKIDAIRANNGHVQLIDQGNEFFLARFNS